MHTLSVIGGGLFALMMCELLGYTIAGEAGAARAALWFVPVWLAAAGVNAVVGVRVAGYSISEEIPMAMVVFAPVMLMAFATWCRLR
jgi:hypothetical protein